MVRCCADARSVTRASSRSLRKHTTGCRKLAIEAAQKKEAESKRKSGGEGLRGACVSQGTSEANGGSAKEKEKEKEKKMEKEKEDFRRTLLEPQLSMVDVLKEKGYPYGDITRLREAEDRVREEKGMTEHGLLSLL